MNLHLITTKIKLIFLLVFLALSVVLLIYVQYVSNRLSDNEENRYARIAQHVKEKKLERRDLKEYVESLDFRKVHENPENVLINATLLTKSTEYEVFLYKNKYYFQIKTGRIGQLFLDFHMVEDNPMQFLWFLLVYLLLISLYIWLVKSLKPLQELKENICKFADGDLSVDCQSVKKDEIAVVANEFDRAVKKIDLLLTSRQLFLRTVMHELKTPIAKGRIVTELLEDKVQHDRLSFIFEKLEYLINDFAKVEEIVSQNYEPVKYKYTLHDIVTHAMDMLMLDDIHEKVSFIEAEETILYVDLMLFSMALKNLIDNGLKYSSDTRVLLQQIDNGIEVISLGEPIQRPIEEYFEPFHNTADMRKQGMGLGLYIVKSIIDKHGMQFLYSYRDASNIFSIKFS